jgi:superfamily II DNA or RNA helicase
MIPSKDYYLTYKELLPLEKSVLDFIALAFMPVNIGYFANDYTQLMGKINFREMSIALNGLRRKGILQESGYAKMGLPVEIHTRIFAEAYSHPQNKLLFQNIQRKYPVNPASPYSTDFSPLLFLREYIAAHFTGNVVIKKAMEEKIVTWQEPLFPYLVTMIELPVYYDLLLQTPPYLLNEIVMFAQRDNILLLKNPEYLEAFLNHLQKHKGLPENLQANVNNILAENSLYRGNLEEAESLTAASSTNLTYIVKSNIEIYRGNYAKAFGIFERTKLLTSTSSGTKKGTFEITLSLPYFLMLLIDPSLVNTREIEKLARQVEKGKIYKEAIALPLLYKVLKNKFLAEKYLSAIIFQNRILETGNYYTYLALVFEHVVNGNLRKDDIPYAESLLLKFEDIGQSLPARELAYILKNNSNNIVNEEKFALLDKKLSFPCLLERIQPRDEWEDSLDGLLNILTGTGAAKGKEKAESNRLVYFVNFDSNYVQPALQTLGKSGNWSKGRNIALKRLKENAVEGMTDQDHRIATAIKYSSGYYGGNDYYFDYDKLYPELAGHPFLFRSDNTDIAVEFVRAQPELLTEKTSKGYILKMDVTETDHKIVVQKETNTRYKLIVLTEQHLNVIRSLNNGRLLIPEKGKVKLLKAIEHLSDFITVHSDLVDKNSTLKTINADSRIRVQLIPVGDTLKAEMFVKPFGNIPPYAKPGKGGHIIFGTVEDEKCQAIRDLKTESNYVNQLMETISLTSDMDLTDGPANFEDPYQCLGLLESLEKHTDIAVIEWPEGERFKIKKFASFANLNLSVKGRGHWFEMDGELRVDEETVLSIKQLLELSNKSKGRFIELKKGEFLALSDEFKKRLDELNSFASIDKSGVKLNKFAATAIGEIAESAASFHTDKQWKDFQKRIRQSGKMEIALPATLDAELRPYQEEGFRWMARLAEWDAGACLADDMGLGKTVQTIAILLHRAELGPALVVCPASVVGNWINELRKFAPTLNPINLRNTNREETFNNLANYDVLVLTYGLLQSEEERIGGRTWSTAVLDEAHAIKNNQTKSSKAAMNIQAGFRVMLTGTPIQNHLGELWNLFNFCNPGLLGTLPQYNERFVNPLQGGDSSSQRQHLKKLISPFILRRTKNVVLDELPPKTEITHSIELSDAEMAFYEAIRRQAIENIETSEGPTGQKHLKALAEITRLRLACCNAALVDKKLDLPSSKLEAFFEITNDLLANKHRALVFSQFIGHLAIVRNELDKRKITYQYLDGSSPLPEREASVKAFQAGKGDLFLISLKAGGLGLNLTAADFVIHLDPWWNPAIEDQASDRAHRIGQNRPVTIYRLVARNTIEEKILQLHSTKRDMADSLLEGSDQSAKMSTDDLLNLLKEI